MLLFHQAPRYVGTLVRVADLPGRRALHSANTDRLALCWSVGHYVGGRAFPVAAPTTWNDLPTCQLLLHLLSHYSLSGATSRPVSFSDPLLGHHCDTLVDLATALTIEAGCLKLQDWTLKDGYGQLIIIS